MIADPLQLIETGGEDEPPPCHSMSRVLVLLGVAVALYLVVKWK